MDYYLVDLATRKAENITAVDRLSIYNSGVFFWPNDLTKLGFTALLDGNSHPFRMDRDGRNKTDLTSGSRKFTYGFSSSCDGQRIAYHKNYQVFLADADGSNAAQVETGQPFNFGPTWSPDGQWVLFVSTATLRDASRRPSGEAHHESCTGPRRDVAALATGERHDGALAHRAHVTHSVCGCDFTIEPQWRRFTVPEHSSGQPNAQETKRFRVPRPDRTF